MKFPILDKVLSDEDHNTHTGDLQLHHAKEAVRFFIDQNLAPVCSKFVRSSQPRMFDLFPRVCVPFDNMWLEFAPGFFEDFFGHQSTVPVGILLEHGDDWPNEWWNENGHEYSSLGKVFNGRVNCTVFLEGMTRGSFALLNCEKGWFVHPYIFEDQVLTEEKKARIKLVESLCLRYSALVAAILFLLVHRETLSEVKTERTQALRRRPNGKQKKVLQEYKTLTLRLPGHIAEKSEEPATSSGITPRLHIVRGHFKKKKNGVFWWSPFWRGDHGKGVIIKDYKGTH